MAALDRTLAFTEMDNVSMGVAQDLDFDVSRAGDITLDEDTVITEATQGLAFRRGDRLIEIRRLLDDAHALAAAPGRGLDENRIANRSGVRRILTTRQDRNVMLRCEFLGGEFVPHLRDGFGRRADPGDSGGRHVAGEFGVLRKESVAGMDCLCARRERGLQDRLAVEIRLGQANGLVRIGLRKAYELLALLGHPVGRAFWDHPDTPPMLERRRRSIMAHGLEPLRRRECEAFIRWTRELGATAIGDSATGHFDQLCRQLQFGWLLEQADRMLTTPPAA